MFYLYWVFLYCIFPYSIWNFLNHLAFLSDLLVELLSNIYVSFKSNRAENGIKCLIYFVSTQSLILLSFCLPAVSYVLVVLKSELFLHHMVHSFCVINNFFIAGMCECNVVYVSDVQMAHWCFFRSDSLLTFGFQFCSRWTIRKTNRNQPETMLLVCSSLNIYWL